MRPNNRLASLKNKKNGVKRDSSIRDYPAVIDIYKPTNNLDSFSTKFRIGPKSS